MPLVNFTDTGGQCNTVASVSLKNIQYVRSENAEVTFQWEVLDSAVGLGGPRVLLEHIIGVLIKMPSVI